jgi:hypothetical protein
LIAGCASTTTQTSTTTAKTIQTGPPVQTTAPVGKRVALESTGLVGKQYVSLFTPQGWVYKGRAEGSPSTAVFAHQWNNLCSSYFTVQAQGTIEPHTQPLHFTLLNRSAKPYQTLILPARENADGLLSEQAELIGHSYGPHVPGIEYGTSNIILTLQSPQPHIRTTCPKNERSQVENIMNEFADNAEVDRFNSALGPTESSGPPLSTHIDTTNAATLP